MYLIFIPTFSVPASVHARLRDHEWVSPRFNDIAKYSSRKRVRKLGEKRDVVATRPTPLSGLFNLFFLLSFLRLHDFAETRYISFLGSPMSK